MKPPSRGVVLAAGIGERLQPLTATRPKPMLPVAGRPLLQYNLEQLAAAETGQALILIPPEGASIERHFGSRFKTLDLRYVVQREARGTGHALSILRDAIGGESFFCMFGDNLTTWPVARLLPVHRETKASATLALFHARDPRRHGIVELDGRLVRSIVERPEHPRTDLASAGMFIFEPEIFEALAAITPTSRGELELPDAIQHLISQGRTVAYEVLDEWRININTPADLLEANHHMLDREDARATAPGVTPPVVALEPLEVKPGARVGPYVSCGRGCIIEAGARVSESILLDSVTIGASAQVCRSILGAGARVAPGARVQDDVVGDNETCG